MKKISLDDLSLRDKVSQMIIVNGKKFDFRFLKLGLGGFFLGGLKTKETYKKIILQYRKKTKISLFFAADMEGYWNPFKLFYNSKIFGEIQNKKQAYSLGKEHGKLMKEIGFNLNFSPVVEIRNKVWPGRSFKGSIDEIKDKITNYILGLHNENILATAKHYPGGNMIRDPHKFKFRTKVFKTDLDLFDVAIKAKVNAIMVGHPSVYGFIDSKEKQCTISAKIISNLRKKFKGIILTDAISMKGIKKSYLFNSKQIYVDSIKAGNDIVLDSNRFTSFSKVSRGIKAIERAVQKGEISKKQINKSVKRILEVKGYSVK